MRVKPKLTNLLETGRCKKVLNKSLNIQGSIVGTVAERIVSRMRLACGRGAVHSAEK